MIHKMQHRPECIETFIYRFHPYFPGTVVYFLESSASYRTSVSWNRQMPQTRVPWILDKLWLVSQSVAQIESISKQIEEEELLLWSSCNSKVKTQIGYWRIIVLVVFANKDHNSLCCHMVRLTDVRTRHKHKNQFENTHTLEKLRKLFKDSISYHSLLA